MEDLEFDVSPDEAGERMDKIVIRRVTGLGRRRARELFESGAVSADGKAATKGQTAVGGERVTVRLADVSAVTPEPEGPLTIRLERPDLVVISKPAGQACHPLRGELGTLAGALLGRFPEMATVGYSRREPGLLHRLDNWTSGLLIAARSPSSFEALRRALAAGAITKRYLAIVLDAPSLEDDGRVVTPLGPAEDSTKRVVVTATGRARETRYRVRARRDGLALVEVSAPRAYRHQIRVHLAHLGHPLLGDVLYGGQADARLEQRHALHASHVAWAGDDTVPGFTVDEPLPEDMGSLIAV